MHTRRFTDKASIYAQYRPSYPSAVLDYLYTYAALSHHSLLADIGAGTGIFSRLLLLRGNPVYCVEPNRSMLEQMQRTLQDFSHAYIIEAPAEATTLPDESVNAITVAQAFHWFDRAAFRQECRRILHPDGVVALLWNISEGTHPFIQEETALLRRFCASYDMPPTRREYHPEEYENFFSPTCSMRVFANDFPTDESSYIGRCLSSSYAPREGDAAYDPFVRGLHALFAKYSKHGILGYPNNTRLYIGRIT